MVESRGILELIGKELEFMKKYSSREENSVLVMNPSDILDCPTDYQNVRIVAKRLGKRIEFLGKFLSEQRISLSDYGRIINDYRVSLDGCMRRMRLDEKIK